VHLEVAKGTAVDNATYCKKDGEYFEKGDLLTVDYQGRRSDIEKFKEDVCSETRTLSWVREHHSKLNAKCARFCIEYMQDVAPKRKLPEREFRIWQSELNIMLNREADDRTIIFIVDRNGNAGKSWFAHFYASRHERVQVLLPGKRADMAYALDNTIRVLFIDAPRSKQSDFIQYDFLEEVKNGYVFSPKYESRFKVLEKCHVCVMMNEDPDRTKLSEDRFHVIEITNTNNVVEGVTR
jgi:hypothetical protein